MTGRAPNSGSGRGSNGSSSSTPGDHDNDEQSSNDQNFPDQEQIVTEIPLGIPMSDEAWQRAKRNAERPQTDE